MSKNYDALANGILENIGGDVNVVNSLHCHTRLRINVKDTGLVNLEALKKLDVAGAQFSGEQVQVIIGTDVADVYRVFSQKAKGKTEKMSFQTTQKKTIKGMLSLMLNGIIGSIAPVLPILIGSGILRAIILIAQELGMLSVDSPTVMTLTFVADAAFYFLPVFIGGFAAKKFDSNIAMGMMMGAILLHPNFTSMVNEGVSQSVFGIPIYNATYSSSIIPVILSVWVMSNFERFVTKVSPKVLRIILVPTLTLVVMIPLSLSVFAPLGSILSGGFAQLLQWINDVFGVFAIAIHAIVIPWIVMTGMHLGTVPVSLESIATSGVDRLVLPAYLISNFSQGSACLAVGVKTKDKELKSFAFSSAFSCMVPGISEPGMYGITLRFKTPMWAATVGSAIGGLYFGITKTGSLAYLNPNIFSFAGYIGTGVYSSNLINAVIGVLISIVVTFVMTMIIYKPVNKF